MTDKSFTDILSLLHHSRTNFILIGGVAGMAHGSARATLDVDVVYSRDSEMIRRLTNCLKPFQPALRGAPAELPFTFDEPTVERGLNFTLTTTLGDLDLLGEVAGGGEYEDLLPYTEVLEVFGLPIRCVTLERLIQLKRAAGRPKDLEAIAELTALLDERRKLEGR